MTLCRCTGGVRECRCKIVETHRARRFSLACRRTVPLVFTLLRNHTTPLTQPDSRESPPCSVIKVQPINLHISTHWTLLMRIHTLIYCEKSKSSKRFFSPFSSTSFYSVSFPFMGHLLNLGTHVCIIYFLQFICIYLKSDDVIFLCHCKYQTKYVNHAYIFKH